MCKWWLLIHAFDTNYKGRHLISGYFLLSAVDWCSMNDIFPEFIARKEEKSYQYFLCLFGIIFCEALCERKSSGRFLNSCEKVLKRGTACREIKFIVVQIWLIICSYIPRTRSMWLFYACSEYISTVQMAFKVRLALLEFLTVGNKRG